MNGVFDKDLKCSTLMRKPQFYKQGINDEVSESGRLAKKLRVLMSG